MKKSSKLWRKNFEIKNVDYQLPWVLGAFYDGFVWSGLKPEIKELIWIHERGDNIGTYILKLQLRAGVRTILYKIVKSPNWADRVAEKIRKGHEEYYSYSKYLDRLDLAKLSDKELMRKFNKASRIRYRAHGISVTTTWLVDSDGEDFSNYLLNYVDKQIKNLKLKMQAAEVFSILTTPTRDSFQRIEEKEALLILKLILKDKKAKEVFVHKDIKKIKGDFENLPALIRKKIISYYKKWRWMPYTYIGPAYDLDFYLEMFGNLIKEKVDPDKLLRKYRVVHQQTRKKQAKFFIKLKIDKRHMHLFKVAQDIVFLKGWRKDILFLGFYAADQILKELAKRKGLSLMQMKYIWPSEIEDVVLRDKISVDELNERKKFSVLYMKNGKVRILIGDKARKFLAKQNFEKIKVVSIKEIKGMCACPGRVRGVVRVVNVPEDMEKMKKGDIMFSHTTFPALVPAMKKAAAIVTEDGGITCHAAIVSREMKTPCVVGVKSLLQVFKDGDRVEVDAADGEIKKLGN